LLFFIVRDQLREINRASFMAMAQRLQHVNDVDVEYDGCGDQN
jgi:hypothetical protein